MLKSIISGEVMEIIDKKEKKKQKKTKKSKPKKDEGVTQAMLKGWERNNFVGRLR